MGKDNWKGFEYPTECILSKLEKAVLTKEANTRRNSPFGLCKKGKRLECPGKIQSECLKRTDHRQHQKSQK